MGQKVSFAGSVEEVREEPSFPSELEESEGAEGGESKDQKNQETEVELGDPPLTGNVVNGTLSLAAVVAKQHRAGMCLDLLIVDF